MNKTTRQNTLKAVFDKNKPRPSALNIHRWMDETLRIQDDHLEALQLVGKQNAVYIKLKNKVIFEQLLNKHRGNNKFMLDDNVETVVTISDAKAEYTHVRVFNLPPELENDHISYKLQSYGIIQKSRMNIGPPDTNRKCQTAYVLYTWKQRNQSYPT